MYLKARFEPGSRSRYRRDSSPRALMNVTYPAYVAPAQTLLEKPCEYLRDTDGDGYTTLRTDYRIRLTGGVWQFNQPFSPAEYHYHGEPSDRGHLWTVNGFPADPDYSRQVQISGGIVYAPGPANTSATWQALPEFPAEMSLDGCTEVDEFTL